MISGGPFVNAMKLKASSNATTIPHKALNSYQGGYIKQHRCIKSFPTISIETVSTCRLKHVFIKTYVYGHCKKPECFYNMVECEGCAVWFVRELRQ